MSAETEQFQAAMAGAGLTPPETIYGDGKIHRFGIGGKSCFYVLHLDGVPAGSFGDWKTGQTETWCAKRKADMSDVERQATWERIKAAQRQRDAERDRSHAEAAAQAVAVWTSAAPAIEHPYLNRKATQPHGIRTDGRQLFVPMRDTTGKLWSLQTISPEGEKRFLSGGRARGCYFSIGVPAGRITICEGFSTGATLREATGSAVAVCFSAGNLMAVARALRDKYPDIGITVAADDDLSPGNPGMTAAKAAAAVVGASLAVPDWTGLIRGTSTDFNDLTRLHREQRAAS